MQALKSIPEFKTGDITLTGSGHSASLACFAAIYEKDVKSLELTSPTIDFRSGPVYLNIEKVIPDARIIPLLSGKPVTIFVKTEGEKANWDWTVDFAKRCGIDPPKVIVKP